LYKLFDDAIERSLAANNPADMVSIEGGEDSLERAVPSREEVTKTFEPLPATYQVLFAMDGPAPWRTSRAALARPRGRLILDYGPNSIRRTDCRHLPRTDLNPEFLSSFSCAPLFLPPGHRLEYTESLTFRLSIQSSHRLVE